MKEESEERDPRLADEGWIRAGLPEAHYVCASARCPQRPAGWDASALTWCLLPGTTYSPGPANGWYCPICIRTLKVPRSARGPTLAEEMARRAALRDADRRNATSVERVLDSLYDALTAQQYVKEALAFGGHRPDPALDLNDPSDRRRAAESLCTYLARRFPRHCHLLRCDDAVRGEGLATIERALTFLDSEMAGPPARHPWFPTHAPKRPR